MTPRPLHAVLAGPADGARLLTALRAALDGTGPALAPLDPALSPSALRAVAQALAPSTLTARDGERVALGDRPPRPGPGTRPDTAVVMTTSGSTGEPKGVELSAGALLASAGAALRRIGARPGERWLCCLPVSHMSGLGVLVRSVSGGTEPLFASPADPDLAAAAAAGCTHVSLVPTQLRRLLDAHAPVHRFATILLGGAAAPPGLLAEARAAGANVVTTYGMTETCGGCVYDGLPLDGVRADVADGGRVRIAGPVLFSGYRLRPEITAAVLTDGWFRTSDLGALDESGRLKILGRADGVIVTGGEKVLAGQVERAVAGLATVREVAVTGVPDREWGELVTAVVVPRDPAAPPWLGQMRHQMRERLPHFALPRRLIVVGELPMLASGKPDRIAVAALARRAAAGRRGGQPPLVRELRPPGSGQVGHA